MILVFAGAGASCAVSREYPTTVDFFQQLPASITRDGLFKELLSYAKSRLEAQVIDIEQILWITQELRQIASAIVDQKTPAGHLLAGNRGAHALGLKIDAAQGVQLASHILRRTEQLEGQINEQVYDWYSREALDEELTGSWLPLLEGLTSSETRVEVFTTNYDLVLEKAIRMSKVNVDTGRSMKEVTTLDVKKWLRTESSLESGRPGLLTKLHGSVDWTRKGDVIFVGNPMFRRNHKEHVILYPGFKGVPDEPPFTLFHEHFSRSVSSATALVFIGFAFRDQHINTVLTERTQRDANISLVNLGRVPGDIPFAKERIRHYGEGFTIGAVEFLLSALLP